MEGGKDRPYFIGPFGLLPGDPINEAQTLTNFMWL